MSGTIYFVTTGEAERVKIGFTKNRPEYRLRELQTGSPFELCIIATVRGSQNDERDLHGRFQKHRLHGEWFVMSQEIMDYIGNANLNEFEHSGQRAPRWARMFCAMWGGATKEEAEYA